MTPPHLSKQQLALFFYQLGTMQSGGVNILSCLKGLETHGKPRSLARISGQLHQLLQQGKSLSQAMRLYPETFSPLMTNLIQAGEASGDLSTPCLENAKILTRRADNYRSIIQKITYPSFLLLTALFLLPLSTLFGGGSAPLLEKLHGYFAYNLYPLTALCALIFLAKSSTRLTQTLKILVFDIPILRTVFKNLEISRFLETLALCHRAHIRADQSARLAVDTLTYAPLQKKLKDLPQRILEGEPTSSVLASKNILSWDLLTLLISGEKTGRTEENLSLAAEELEKKSLHTLTIGLSLVGPGLLIIVGGFIGLNIIKTSSQIFDTLK